MLFRRSSRNDGQVPRRRKGWIVAAGVVAAVALTFLTGFPQTFIARRVAERALGTRVVIEGLSILGKIRAAEVYIYGGAPGTPFARLSGLSVDYRLLASEGRRIDSVIVDALYLHPDGRDWRNPNYRFLQELLARPRERTDEPSPYLPRTIQIGRLVLDADFPGMGLRLDSLRVEGGFDGKGSFTTAIAGKRVKGSWRADAYELSGVFDDGRVDLHVVQQRNGFRVAPMDVHLPGFAEVNGNAMAESTGDKRTLNVELDRFLLNAVDLGHAEPTVLPFPLRFAGLDLSGTRARVEQTPEGVFLPEAQLNAAAKALGVGLAGKEWYAGDLTLHGSGKDRHYTAEAVLGQGQRVELTADGTPLEATATLKLDGWTRDQMIGAAPVIYRSRLEAVSSVDGLSGSVAVEWRKPAYTVKGSLKPSIDGKPGSIEADGSGALGETPGFDGTIRAALGAGTAVAHARIDSASRFAVTADLKKADLHRWLTMIHPLPVPGHLLGIGTGKVSLTSTDDFRMDGRLHLEELGVGQDVAAEVEATASAPSLNELRSLEAKGTVGLAEAGGRATFDLSFLGEREWRTKVNADSLDAATLMSMFNESTWLRGTGSKLSGQFQLTVDPSDAIGSLKLTAAPTPIPQVLTPADVPLTVDGSFTADPGFQRIKGQFDFRSSDEVSARLSNASLVRKGFVLKGDLEATIPATRLAPLQKLEEAGGILTATGPIKYADGAVTAEFHVVGEEFGVGRYAAPVGLPMVAAGTVRYDVGKREGRIDKLTVDWSEPTSLRFEPMTFTAEPRVEETPYTLQTDLAPLVYWGLVQEADGKATAAGTLAYGRDGLALYADYSLEAPSMTLSNKIAVMGGVASKGRIEYTKGFGGSGKFGAATITAAGATVRDAIGPFTLKENVLRSDDLRGTLWKGALAINDASIDFGDPQLTVAAKGTVEGLDLATFTEEYKPPKARLTGLGKGEVSVQWSRAGFAALDVALESSENLTVNRDLVYQLLMSQYIKEAKPGRKVDRVVNEVIGKADQRPFTRAAMDLGMAGPEERIAGETVLESKDLRLTIDMKMDPKALSELLRLRQENNLENIARISTAPIKLGE